MLRRDTGNWSPTGAWLRRAPALWMKYGVLFRNLFSMAGIEVQGIHGIVISSVVPPLDPVLRQVCERYFNPVSYTHLTLPTKRIV